MQNFTTKELKIIREALESIITHPDKDTVNEAIQKLDSMLEKEGYRFERKAFFSEWKKIEKK